MNGVTEFLRRIDELMDEVDDAATPEATAGPALDRVEKLIRCVVYSNLAMVGLLHEIALTNPR